MSKIVQTEWFTTAERQPPFHKLILAMFAGSATNVFTGGWHRYTDTRAVRILRESPNDGEPGSEASEFETGDRDKYQQFQFCLRDLDDEEIAWFSDSIVAWTPYPDDVAEWSEHATEALANEG